jgi:hypothetical protein
MASAERNLASVLKGSSDARANMRHLLNARVVFQWNDDTGFQKVGRGHTRDISQKGAYVVSPERPPKGAYLTMHIYLPALVGDSKLLSIQAECQVLRVEPNARVESTIGWGFAVSNQQVTLSTI